MFEYLEKKISLNTCCNAGEINMAFLVDWKLNLWLLLPVAYWVSGLKLRYICHLEIKICVCCNHLAESSHMHFRVCFSLQENRKKAYCASTTY